MADELYFQTIASLSDRLAEKELSSVELTKAVIARTQAVESQVHAFNSFDAEDALAQAAASDARREAGEILGPLDGIPVGLKDVIAVENQPLTASSKMLADFVSPYDATVTQNLKKAGAVIWGRLIRDGIFDRKFGHEENHKSVGSHLRPRRFIWWQCSGSIRRPGNCFAGIGYGWFDPSTCCVLRRGGHETYLRVGFALWVDRICIVTRSNRAVCAYG